MRIVLSTSDLAIGGAERNVVSYACALLGRGHDVTVAAGDGPLAAELAACGVPRLAVRTHLRRPQSILTAALALRHAHSRRPIDVVHAFMASASSAAALARIGTRASFGLIAAPPGVAQGRTEARWVGRLRLRVLGAGADLVIVPSRDLREHVTAAGVPAHRIREIDFNAVDLRRFEVAPAARASLGLEEGDRVVCSVARLHAIKGQDLLIRAAAGLRALVPRVKILIVGAGPERRSLERLAKSEGVADVVTFLGERTDVPAILGAVDVVVQTTFGTGGPGLAVLEAFAAARPVVGFTFGDLRDAVADTDAALLVERGDVAGLRESIASVLLDPARARSMGQRGRALVERRYDTEHVIDRLEAVYRELGAARIRA